MLEGLAHFFAKDIIWIVCHDVAPFIFFSSPRFLASMMLIVKCCAMTPLMAFPMSLWRSKVSHFFFFKSMSSLNEVVVDLWLLGSTYLFFSFFCALYLKIQPTRFSNHWFRFELGFHHAFIPILKKVTMFVILLDVVDNTTKHWKEH